jgi:glutaredoxin 3
MAKIEVYSMDNCPYCLRAKRLLDSKGARYEEWQVDHTPELRAEMEARSGGTSVPQIFIDDRHIGGFDELSALEIDGELDRLLGIENRTEHG